MGLRTALDVEAGGWLAFVAIASTMKKLLRAKFLLNCRNRELAVLGLLLLALCCTRRSDQQAQTRNPTPITPTPAASVDLARAESRQAGLRERTQSGVRLAIVGDEGVGSRARAVLDLVRSESADALVVVGDFDYENKPHEWRTMLEGLGPEFPWFAVVGNHDVHAWPDYERLIAEKLRRIKGAHCHGKPGRQASCLFRGAQLVLSEIGTMGDRDDNEAFIRRELSESQAQWKLCLWHKNQHDMQTGAKTDEVGWGAYRACQDAGAIIVNGHEHSYARSRTLTALGDRAQGYGAVGDLNALTVGPGKTFVTVSGLGGIQTRPFVMSHESDTWWAAYLTADRESVNGQVRQVNNANVVGAFFLDLGIDGDSSQGRGRFVATDARLFDDFKIKFVQ